MAETGSNTCGKITITTRSLQRWRLLHTSSSSWLGCRPPLTTSLLCPARLVRFIRPMHRAQGTNPPPGVPFPKTFPNLVRQIFKRMYRVYAHIYCHHYPVIRELGLEPHLNTSFKQYVLFIDEHSLASGRDYWGPLGDLVDSMLKSD